MVTQAATTELDTTVTPADGPQPGEVIVTSGLWKTY